MKTYTVLLLYPDYSTHDYGGETYLAVVQAPDAGYAVFRAQVEAETASCDEDGGYIAADDFRAIAVFEGACEWAEGFTP